MFVIRIAERKIDESLDSAMLDFESLDDFEEVRFQDQWNIFRSLTARKKRETPRAAGIFAMPGSPSLDRRSDYGGDSPRRAPISPSPARSSIQEFKAETREALANGIEKATALFTDNKPSPRKVTDVLTNVLVILQLYDVNPAFIVQVFSQTFYWIASELFNRIITRKKYLCRTKAVQIRMNITVLEEWTRTNGLPPRVASRHLEPVMQLLQWLQCLSQINQFDMLIGTVQNLRALNPLQMRRAVRDYRFEVDEGRMADDCVQYLAQMQKDWERRRVHIGVNAANQAGGVLGLPLEEAGDESMSIEALFDSSVGVGEWAPQSAPECIGELVDSRFMLPFLVPTSVEFLLATPPPDSAFRNLPTEVPPNSDGTPRSRPISISSYTSTKPMGWDAPSGQRVRRLPDDFLPWLKERQAEYSRERGMQRDKLVDPGRPAPPSPEKNLPSLPEHPVTPTKSLPRVPQSAHNTPHSTPSDVHARKASTDMAMRRSQADMTPPGVEPIEMSFRPSQNGLASPSPAAHAYPPTPSRSQGQPPYRAPSVSNSVSSPPSSSSHYELGRVPHERQASVSSQTSVSSSSGSGKRWLKAARQASVSASPEDLRRREREDTADTIVPNMPSPSPRRREVELASPQGSPVRR